MGTSVPVYVNLHRMPVSTVDVTTPDGVAYTSIYSRRDGIVDHRACLDPQARTVEVSTSHVGMVVDPRVIDLVREVLAQPPGPSLVEVDRGEIA